MHGRSRSSDTGGGTELRTPGLLPVLCRCPLPENSTNTSRNTTLKKNILCFILNLLSIIWIGIKVNIYDNTSILSTIPSKSFESKILAFDFIFSFHSNQIIPISYTQNDCLLVLGANFASKHVWNFASVKNTFKQNQINHHWNEQTLFQHSL